MLPPAGRPIQIPTYQPARSETRTPPPSALEARRPISSLSVERFPNLRHSTDRATELRCRTPKFCSGRDQSANSTKIQHPECPMSCHLSIRVVAGGMRSASETCQDGKLARPHPSQATNCPSSALHNTKTETVWLHAKASERKKHFTSSGIVSTSRHEARKADLPFGERAWTSLCSACWRCDGMVVRGRDVRVMAA